MKSSPWASSTIAAQQNLVFFTGGNLSTGGSSNSGTCGAIVPIELVNSLGVDVAQVIRDLGTSLGVPVIDLTVTVWNWQQSIGNGWTNYYALGTDHTHTNPAGADMISGFVADAIRDQNIGLITYLR